MLSHCSFLGTALYGYVALALRAKQWEDGSIMPVTVRGARGGITRALWLRMYAAACPGHACIGTEHSRGHWEGWILQLQKPTRVPLGAFLAALDG